MEEDLEEFVEKLQKIRGRHTELVTVYIPAGFNISSVTKQLEAEKGTATNIKSKSTRKAVLNALERIIRHLKTVEKLPLHGLAIFCGNVSENEGQEDIQIWSIEPPQPLKTRLYRCDQTFVLEPLIEMYSTGDLYGLMVLDRKEATIAMLDGKRVEILRKMTSGIPGKQRAGGQSAARFSRIHEGLTKEFYRRVADAMKELFFHEERIKGIIIGGPLPTKEEFMKEGNLVTALKDKVLGLKDLGYADEHGIELLVEESEDLLAQQEIIHEKKILERFFLLLAKEPGKAVYGFDSVRKAIDLGAVEVLLVSKPFKEKATKLIEDAERTSSTIEIISTDNDDGTQFYNLAEIGAILRFEIG